MTGNPLVSVIMNCLNSEKYLREAMDSVFAQTYPNWEIIFWDNDSTDGSAAIAKSYGEQVRYFKSEKTVPLGQARNWAIEQAKGEFIAFLDCDDIWMPKKLEKQIPLFQKNPRTGLVYSNTVFFSQATGSTRQLYNRLQPRGAAFRELLSNYFLSMETVVLRRECLDGLAEWFDKRFSYIEEADLFTRIAHDWELEYVDEPLARWRIHSESLTWKNTGLFGQELKIMIEKYETLYSNFRENYRKEIRKVQARAAYRQLQEYWMKNDKPAARKIIRPWLAADFRLAVIYVLTIFSYRTYSRIHGFVRSIV